MKNVINRALVAKKQLFLFAALLMASTALCLEQQTVSYTYPVYNTDGDPTSGIKEWKTATEYGVFVLTSYNSNVSIGTAGESSWYVVTGSDVTLSKGFYCVGNVNLILADGAKLTVGENIYTAGIQVSGEGNSLTIYGQANQSGKLIATGGNGGDAGIGGKKNQSGSNITINGGIITVTGRDGGAGIGGGYGGSGSNITINGGTVTANGVDSGAGIGGGAGASGSKIIINGGTVTANGVAGGAGIGGGGDDGYDITINDGMVTANGGQFASGIGGGDGGSGYKIFINGGTVTANGGADFIEEDFHSGIGGLIIESCFNIKVATDLIVKADGNNPPTTVIENNGGDLAEVLAGKPYVTIEMDLTPFKTEAIAEINSVANAAKAEIDKASTSEAAKDKQNYYKSLIDATVLTAKNAINNATTKKKVDSERINYVSSINSKKFEALEEITFIDAKAAAIAEITTARQGIQNTEVNQWIDAAINDIQKGGPNATPGIDEIKEEILTIINFVQIGKAEGLGSLAEPCDDCHAVEVKKGTTVVTLYAPDEVKFKKTEAAED